MKFWLIDADSDDRTTFREMLKKYFPEIECQTFDVVPDRINCDAIFLGQRLGSGVSGHDAARRLRKEGLSIPIVIITDNTNATAELLDACDGVAYKNVEASFFGSAKGMIRLIESHHHDTKKRLHSFYG